jgi:hypothetical protein
MLKMLENFGARVYFTMFISEYICNLEFYFGVHVYSRVVSSDVECAFQRQLSEVK